MHNKIKSDYCKQKWHLHYDYLKLFKTYIIAYLVPDNYIPTGETTLDLCRLPKPAKNKDDVSPSLEQQMMANTNANSIAISFPNDDIPTVNLFEAKRVYGFYPFIRLEDGQPKIAVSSGNNYNNHLVHHVANACEIL